MWRPGGGFVYSRIIKNTHTYVIFKSRQRLLYGNNIQHRK